MGQRHRELEQRTIEVNIISASDLKKVRNFAKQTSYAVVYIYPEDKKSSTLDRVGGLNPIWNSKLMLTFDEKLRLQPDAHLTVELYSPGSFSAKFIGYVYIPLRDIPSEDKGSSSSKNQSMSLEVRRRSGRTQGLLNVSVKLGGTTKLKLSPAQTYAFDPLRVSSFGDTSTPVTAYPAQAPQGYSFAGGTYSSNSQYPAGGGMYSSNSQYSQYAPYDRRYGAQQAQSTPYGYGAGTYGPYQQPVRRHHGPLGLLAAILGGFLLGDILF